MNKSGDPHFPDRLPNDITLGPDLDLDREEFITPSGRRLTNEYAEELTRRVTGRPSLTAPGKHSPALNLRISERLKARLETVAAAQHRRQSDVVRDALEDYLATH